MGWRGEATPAPPATPLELRALDRGQAPSGIVRDVSEQGLYVQTRVRAATGDELELVFAAEGERAELRVNARVARLDRLTAHFATWARAAWASR